MACFRCLYVLSCVCWILCLSIGGCPSASNAAPQADDQAVVVSFNTSKAITLTATDPDNGPLALAYSIVSSPTHGTLSGSPPSVTYTPETGFSGTDSFKFAADDGADYSNTATVSITVLAAGATPDSGQTGDPFTRYRGTIELTWRQESSLFGTVSSVASGTVEFADSIDITQLYTQYGPGRAFAVVSASSPAVVSDWNSVMPSGATATQTGGGTSRVSWGWLYILDSGEVAFELNVNGTLTEEDCPPPGEGACSTRNSASAFAAFSGGGCPLVFVAAGADLGSLSGSASETCTIGGSITQTATLNWELTGE
ncbi:MAG: Ig-like domain-containing protein [Planctomycetes bacterium]|nr:Ig-like domain-containing protein [Planctomycetota bacterium]